MEQDQGAAGDQSMTASRIEQLGNRIVTLRRARVVAAMSVAALLLTYGSGLVRRHGLIDGFGHVIGGDLLEQRVASQMTRDGFGDRLYDFELQARYEQAAVSPETLPGLIPFMGPPYVSLVYWPLTPLRHELAFGLWTAFGLGCLIASLLWLGRDYPWVTPRLPTVALLSLSFFPVIEGMMAGSNQMVSLLLMTAIFLSLKRGHDGAAGVLLGLQLFKPQLAIAIFVVLAFKRRWRALAGFGAVALLWALLSMLFVSGGALVDYLQVIPTLARLAFVEGFPYYLLSSLYALFVVPMGPNQVAVSNLLGTLTSLAVLGMLLRVWSGPWKTDSEDFDLRFAATLVVTPLVSQYFLLHDLTVMVLAAVLLANYWMQRPASEGWGTMRFSLAVLWVACFVGPILTQRFHVPVVPLAALFAGWPVWISTKRRADSPTAQPVVFSSPSPGWQ